MHHHIVVKVWAGDEDDAEAQATSAIEDSVSPEENTVGWEYSDHVTLITRLHLPQYGVKTFVELEESLLKDRQDRMNGLIGEVKRDLTEILAPYFLAKDEAPLFIDTDNDGLRNYIEKLLKRKKDIKKPDRFEKIVDVVTEITVGIAKKDVGHSLTMHRLEQIKKLQYCFETTDLYNTLQSHENHYAEIPCNDKTGLTAYYFECDRKF